MSIFYIDGTGFVHSALEPQSATPSSGVTQRTASAVAARFAAHQLDLKAASSAPSRDQTPSPLSPSAIIITEKSDTVPHAGVLTVEFERKTRAASEAEIGIHAQQLAKTLSTLVEGLEGFTSISEAIGVANAILILSPLKNIRAEFRNEHLERFLRDRCHVTGNPDELKAAFEQLWKGCKIKSNDQVILRDLLNNILFFKQLPGEGLAVATRCLNQPNSAKSDIPLLQRLCNLIKELTELFEPTWIDNCDQLECCMPKLGRFKTHNEEGALQAQARNAKGLIFANRQVAEFCDAATSLLKDLKQYTHWRLKAFGQITRSLDIKAPDFPRWVDVLFSTSLLCNNKVKELTQALTEEIVSFATYFSINSKIPSTSLRTRVRSVNLFRKDDTISRQLYLDLVRVLQTFCNHPTIVDKTITKAEAIALFGVIAEILASSNHGFDISKSTHKDNLPRDLFPTLLQSCISVINKWKENKKKLFSRHLSIMLHLDDISHLSGHIRRFQELSMISQKIIENHEEMPWAVFIDPIEEVFFVKKGCFIPTTYNLDNIDGLFKSSVREKAPQLRRQEEELKRCSIEGRLDQAPTLLNSLDTLELRSQSIKVSTELFASIITALGSVVKRSKAQIRAAQPDNVLKTLQLEAEAEAEEAESKRRAEPAAAQQPKRKGKSSPKAVSRPPRRQPYVPKFVVAMDWSIPRLHSPLEASIVNLRLDLAARYHLDPTEVYPPANMQVKPFTPTESLQRQHLFHTDCLALAVGLQAHCTSSIHQPFLTQVILQAAHRALKPALVLHYRKTHPDSVIVKPSLTTLMHGVALLDELSFADLPDYLQYPWNFNPVEGKELPLALKVIQAESKHAATFTGDLKQWLERFSQLQLSLMQTNGFAAAAKQQTIAVVEEDRKQAKAQELHFAGNFLDADNRMDTLIRNLQTRIEAERKSANNKVVKPLQNMQFHLQNMREALCIAIRSPQQRFIYVIAEALTLAARGFSLNMGAFLASKRSDTWAYPNLYQYVEHYGLGQGLSSDHLATTKLIDIPGDAFENPCHHFASDVERYEILTILSDFFSRSMEALFMDGKDGANAAAGKYKDAKTVQKEFEFFANQLVAYVCALSALHLK